MRIVILQLTILLLFIGCNRDDQRFDIKTRDFNQLKSHHYSQSFEDKDQSEQVLDQNKVEDAIFQSNNASKFYDFKDTLNNAPISDKNLITSFFSFFSFSNDEIDSLDKAINQCEERLYTSTDDANTKQTAINSLIEERNELLKQLDSLQTIMSRSSRKSTERLVALEGDYQQLKSLIKILSSEIE